MMVAVQGRMPLRVGVLAGVVLLAITGAACSGGDNAGGTGGPVVAGPSDVDVPGTTSALPPTVPAVSLPATVATVPTSPPPSPASTAPATVASSIASGTSAASAGYKAVAPPAFPDRTAPPPTGDGLPDGTYYGVVKTTAPTGASAPSVTLTLYEVLTGGPAISAAAADGAGLDSDIYVRPNPNADWVVRLTSEVELSVAQPDKPDVSYAVSAAELLRLLGGGAPGHGAPPTYHYIPFPYLLTVQDGAPVRLEQLWSQ